MLIVFILFFDSDHNGACSVWWICLSESPPPPGLTRVVNYFQMMLQEREISPESDDISTVSSRDNITVMTTRRSAARSAALQRIGTQQDRWKQQVSTCTCGWSVVVGCDDLDLSLITSGPGTADTDIRSTHDAQLKKDLYLYLQSDVK